MESRRTDSIYGSIEETEPDGAIADTSFQKHYDFITVHEYPGSINTPSREEDIDNEPDGIQTKHPRKPAVCTALKIVLLLFGIPLSIVGLVVMSISAITQHDHVTVPGPVNGVGHIGGNSVVLFQPNCFNPQWIQKVIVYNLTVVDPQHVPNSLANFQFYKTQGSNLKYETYCLQRKTLYSQVRLSYNQSFDASYYYPEKGEQVPVYTAGYGNLTYLINLEYRTSPISCPLELYLFNDHYHYIQLLSLMPPSGYVNKECIINTGWNEVFFSLNESGFYYVAFSVMKDVQFTIEASAELTRYNVSLLSEENCLLSSTSVSNSCCSFVISDSFNHEPVALLAATNNSYEWKINVCVVHVYTCGYPDSWCILPLIGLVIGLVVIVFCATIILGLIIHSTIKYCYNNERTLYSNLSKPLM